MSNQDAVAIDSAVSAFMRAQGNTNDRIKCLVQVRLDNIKVPPQPDSSLVGTIAPGGYTRMPTVQRSIHETVEARQRTMDLYQRLFRSGMGTDAKNALSASGIDLALTGNELSVVASWNELVGAISQSGNRYILVPVPKHWNTLPAKP